MLVCSSQLNFYGIKLFPSGWFVANFRHLIIICLADGAVQILQCCEHCLQSIILFPD